MSWPSTGWPKETVALLRREGFWNLSGYEGCLCGSIDILGYAIDVACRKSSGTASGETKVTVSWRHMDIDASMARTVAEEVKRQVLEQEPHAHVTVVIQGDESPVPPLSP